MKTSLLVFAVATSVMLGTANAARWHTPPASVSSDENHNNPTAGKPDLIFPDNEEDEDKAAPVGRIDVSTPDGEDMPPSDAEEPEDGQR
jgi:hypothetical protein